PRVAEAVSEDLGAALFPVGKRVVCGDRERISLVHIDPKNFAEQYSCILAVALRRMALAFVIGVTAVADGDLKIAIRPEGDAAAVVGEIRLFYFAQQP